jgi:hypothetical protein
MLTHLSDTPAPAPAPAAPASPLPAGIDAFPSLDEPSLGSSEVRITGVAGAGQDAEREKFESAFPDLSGEVGYDEVSKATATATAAATGLAQALILALDLALVLALDLAVVLALAGAGTVACAVA